MTTVIVSHSVADFDTWKPVYDAHEGRAANGCQSAEVLRSTDDPNAITIVMRYPSTEQAQGFLNDASLKEAMKNAGVQGAPDIRVLESVELTEAVS